MALLDLFACHRLQVQLRMPLDILRVVTDKEVDEVRKKSSEYTVIEALLRMKHLMMK